MEETIPLNPGDLVDVPWGLDSVAGIVLESYVSGGVQRVRVAVQIPGSDTRDEIVVRALDLLGQEQAVEGFAKAGGWLRHATYERQIIPLIGSLLDDLQPDTKWQVSTAWSEGKTELDAIIESSRLAIIIEIKWSLGQVFQMVVPMLKRAMGIVRSRLGVPTVSLVISPNSPKGTRSNNPMTTGQLTSKVYFARWRGDSDTDQLIQVLRLILSSSDDQD
ncbi:hypothetical protein GCM10017691_12580 [Pseudonocardia petroleophila]